MTADDARALVGQAKAVSSGTVAALVRLWETAISGAAKKGETSIREHLVGTLRGMVSSTERAAALEHLRASGFTVKTVQTGHNEYETEVSWG